MKPSAIWTPPKAASKIIKVVETFSAVHGTDRFPLDVPTVAREAANIFGWTDPITEVQAADIDSFQGALIPNDARTKWMLLYNDSMASPGRIRFTQAHELGHYILHRTRRDGFHCGDREVLGGPGDDTNIESQADTFASYLLMPIDDFKLQLPEKVDLHVLGRCAMRYGVSLTATVLKWIQFTEEKAMIIISRDGFIDWAWSSQSAASSGAFYKSRQETIEIPAGTLTADNSIAIERDGIDVEAAKWFKHADNGLSLREMKVQMDRFDCTLTLLIMPRLASFWPPSSSAQLARSGAP
jgi:hypothetical protein